MILSHAKARMKFRLSAFYIKRSLTRGKFYFYPAVLFLPVVFLVAYLINPGGLYLSESLTIYPFMIPLMSVLGVLPFLSYFVTDKRKGFYEYLYATTETTVAGLYSSLFISVLLISAVVVAVSSAVFLSLSGITSTPLSVTVIYFLIYSLPVGFIAPLLTMVVATTWTVMTQPIMGGMGTQPLGVVPLMGVIIVAIPIFIIGNVNVSKGLNFLEIYSISLLIVFFCAVLISARTLSPERFLP